MNEAVHSLQALAADMPQGESALGAERSSAPTMHRLLRLVAVLFAGAVLLYVGASRAENSGAIGGLTEDLLHTIALLLVYAPGVYVARGVLHERSVRLAFTVALAFMVLYRIIDIMDEFPVLEHLWLLGTRTTVFQVSRQLLEAAAILGPLAAFYLIIQNLGSARNHLSREIEMRTREMTDRLRTERALVESEQKFRTLAQTTTAAIFIFKGVRCIYSNLAAQSILGYSIDEMSVTPFFEQLAGAAATGDHADRGCPQRFEIRATTKNGETRWLDMSLGPAHIDGERVVLGTAFDITERKSAEHALAAHEEWYRSLLMNSSDIFCVLKEDGTIRYVAASQADVIGRDPEGDLAGKNVLDFVHPDDRDGVHGFLAHAAATMGITGPLEVRIRDRRHNYRTLEIVCNNRLASTCVQGLVINARDISERKQLEEQLHQSQKMDALGRLAGGVAHDFNNVLTSIFVYTEILDARLAEHPGLVAKVHEIRKAAERAARLTRQLLAFSRHRVEQARPMNINTTIIEMYKMLECLIGEDIVLTTDLEHDLNDVVADSAHLEQVLLNLVLNARDAMPDGGGIAITTRNIDVEEGVEEVPGVVGPHVVLSVEDTGCGMDSMTKARVFEPFYTTKQEGKGTGLGLATVYRILQEYGARITVDSTLGVGTRFTIYFPRASAPAEAEVSSEEMPVSHEGTETILVVEDDQEIRSLACRILQNRGYTIIEATTPLDALAIAARHDVSLDMILTDVVMPQMSGPTLVMRVRKQRPGLRVLYISGYTNDAILRNDSTSTSGFLPKPFTAQSLAAKVRDVLDAPKGEGSWWAETELRVASAGPRVES